MSISAAGFVVPPAAAGVGFEPSNGAAEVRPPQPPSTDTSQAPRPTQKGDESDRVEVSDEARKRAGSFDENAEQVAEEEENGPGELDENEQDLVTRLKSRDAEVRAHEQAHLRAAGDLANGGPKYDYQVGPDGKRYAVGGSVSIDTSKVPNDPEATLQKADRIKRAALAPVEPSSQDNRVAAKADQLKAEARRDIQEASLEEARLSREEQKTDDDDSSSNAVQGSSFQDNIAQNQDSDATPGLRTGGSEPGTGFNGRTTNIGTTQESGYDALGDSAGGSNLPTLSFIA